MEKFFNVDQMRLVFTTLLSTLEAYFTPTTEANSPTFGQPNSPWQQVTQLCQWVVINVNAENFTKTY